MGLDSAQRYLKRLHTLQLKKLREKAYAVSRMGGQQDRMSYVDVTNTLTVSVQQIKDELRTRERVPNKAQAKVIRQQKAKERMN